MTGQSVLFQGVGGTGSGVGEGWMSSYPPPWAELQMKQIKKLKFNETHKFKRKANEDQHKFNPKLAESTASLKNCDKTVIYLV